MTLWCEDPEELETLRPRRTRRNVGMQREAIEHLGRQVVDGAMTVHSALGPGVLESAYEACLAHELRLRGLDVRTQVPLPVTYKGVRVDLAYRIDMLVGDAVIVELKTVEKLLPIHEVQLLSYLRLGHRRLGLLINFHAMHLRDGIRRVVHKL
jgi:GxxExxY protein